MFLRRGKGLVRDETLPPRGQAAAASRRLIKKKKPQRRRRRKRTETQLTFDFEPVAVVRVAVGLKQVLELLLVLGLLLLDLPAFDLGQVQILHLHQRANTSNGSIQESLQFTKQSQYSLSPWKNNKETGDGGGWWDSYPFFSGDLQLDLLLPQLLPLDVVLGEGSPILLDRLLPGRLRDKRAVQEKKGVDGDVVEGTTITSTF